MDIKRLVKIEAGGDLGCLAVQTDLSGSEVVLAKYTSDLTQQWRVFHRQCQLLTRLQTEPLCVDLHFTRAPPVTLDPLAIHSFRTDAPLGAHFLFSHSG